jgi:ketosteroid isomerase-like protein
VFPRLHGNKHVIKTDQVIAVGNEVCSVGEWSCTVQDQSGSTIKVHGYYTDVNFREGNTWKVRISTFNFAPPAETK